MICKVYFELPKAIQEYIKESPTMGKPSLEPVSEEAQRSRKEREKYYLSEFVAEITSRKYTQLTYSAGFINFSFYT